MWVWWCRNALSDGWFAAARNLGQAPWPARFLGLSGSQRLRGQGRPQAVAQRSRSDHWGWRGGPVTCAAANHTITDVTGLAKPPRSSLVGLALPRRRAAGRALGASGADFPGWVGNPLRFRPSGRARRG